KPEVPAYGDPGTGELLEEGMVISVEAQVVAGSDKVFIDKDDGWSVVTADERNSVMFEYMVIIGKNKPEVLADNRDWEVIK
ncbi:MAG: type I methionyl aminopeptidase, partial [Candidatus Dojkabacteria bacterium]